MELFAHPWYMAFGGILISVPILIHLINRMRFKVIRWAAMEFLLKSQKRNQRRMIIEQLILLLLRILLVLLVGFLVARFLYGGNAPRGATHEVWIDDTLSMNDIQSEGGNQSSAFDQAKQTVGDVIKSTARANAAQTLRVHLFSQLEGEPVFEGLVGSGTEERVSTALIGATASQGGKATLMAGSPLPALKKARAYFSELKSENNQTQPVLHLVSDYRESDWVTGPDAQDIVKEVRGLLEDGVHVSLLDIAAPFRSDKQRVTLHHDNLAITNLRADARVAIEESNVDFTATIHNFGTAPSRGGQLKVEIDGEESLGSDQNFSAIAAGGRIELKFPLRFVSKKRTPVINPEAKPEERERIRRSEREYHYIRVKFAAPEVNGLNQDNVRDMVLEVRRRVPVLVVDGNKPSMRGDRSDIKHITSFVNSSGTYDIEKRTLEELKASDLELYPCIFLVNVPEVTDKLTLKKLKDYVQGGGSLCYFLGEEVRADNYNTVLFKEGLFPLKLSDRPFDPLMAGFPDPQKREEERVRLRQTDRRPKILFPKKGGKPHPVVTSVERLTSWFRFLSVNIYWKARPKSEWDPDGKQTEALIMLPNTESVKTYGRAANELMRKIVPAVNRLANDPDYKAYPELIDAYAKRVSNTVLKGELYFVAEVLEEMLTLPEVRDKDNKKIRPGMNDLWKAPELRSLADEVRAFRDQILYGDPLMVARNSGRGRVVAMLTTAGTQKRRAVAGEEVEWNDWGTQGLVGATYPLFMKDLYRFLISEGEAPNRLVGENVTFSVDASRYEPTVIWSIEEQPDISVKAEKLAPDKHTTVMGKAAGQYTFSLPDSARKKPGVFRFLLLAKGAKVDDERDDDREVRAYAYNVDALAESNLKRSTTARLTGDETSGATDGRKGKLNLAYPGIPIINFQEEVPDASESPWLYLFFILILVVEQALAVHLSYHLKPDEATGPSQSTAPQQVAA